jgi:uncharacterized repeat protein (TIGR01451 family)
LFVSMTPAAGNPDSFNFAQSGGTLTETANAAVAAGHSDTFTLVVSAPSSLASGANFSDTASASSTTSDPNTANNSATVAGTIATNADVRVTMSGPTSTNEGNHPSYTITVKNLGPGTASGISVTDTLGPFLSFSSATASQGTFSQSGAVVTFSVGSLANGASATLTVTGLATEDGSTSNVASATSTSPDPNSANNSASKVTAITEPSISVSRPITTSSTVLTDTLAGSFTHASAVEPVSAFTATIDWGDGTTSPGNIVLSGTTYKVRGSHTYSSGGKHTITVTASEVDQGVDKVGDDHPGGDVLHYPGKSPPEGKSADVNAQAGSADRSIGTGTAALPGAGGVTFVSAARAVGAGVVVPPEAGSKGVVTSAGSSQQGSAGTEIAALDHFFSLGSEALQLLLSGQQHTRSLTDPFLDSGV